jgi:hypothetical protein
MSAALVKGSSRWAGFNGVASPVSHTSEETSLKLSQMPFLGVLLAAEGFDDMPPLRRGAKFDWLFEMCCRATRISDVVDSIGLPEIKEVLPTIETNTETRSESGIGLSAHCCVCCCRTIHSYWRSTRGIFLLAAVECLGRVGAKRDRGQRHRIDSLDVWVNGRRFKHGEALPKAHNKALQADERRDDGVRTVL